ncbi:MAG: hypothetical protein QM764_13840 [Chitinophagaceae bacterium]
MIYKRSSFINLLKEKYTCTIQPLRDKDIILIRNGPAHKYMYLDKSDRIDYEEIYSCYKKLCLEDLPSTKDLEPAEELPIIKKKADKKKNNG